MSDQNLKDVFVILATAFADNLPHRDLPTAVLSSMLAGAILHQLDPELIDRLIVAASSPEQAAQQRQSASAFIESLRLAHRFDQPLPD